MNEKNFLFHLPTRIIFGYGALNRLGEEIVGWGEKCLFICGRKFAKEAGWVERISQILKKVGIQVKVFAEVEPDPSMETVEKGVEVCKEWRPDFLLCLGGGSVLDAGKAISLLYTKGGNLKDYFRPYIIEEEVSLLPLIAIPSTSGTGSEVTKFSVITDHKEKRKRVLVGFPLCPTLTILDPEITFTMSPSLTANTGMDALSHALESFWAKSSTPFTDILNIESIKVIYEFLPLSFSDGENRKAREEMLYASLLAGVSINSTGTTLIHALGYSLTVHRGIHHGLANAILLPYVLEYNLPACLKKLSWLQEILEKERRGSLYQRAYNFLEEILTLRKILKIPHSLQEIGVKEEEISQFAQEASREQVLLKNNPRFPSFQELEKILKRAWAGEIGGGYE